MKILIGIIILSGIFFATIAITEEYVHKMKDTSKFKKWWRRHVVGHYTGDRDL